MLLSGQHPGGGSTHSAAELVKAIVETSPARLSDTVTSTAASSPEALTDNADKRATTPAKLKQLLRGDLDNIVAKALKKIPAERYGSVTAFADDINRYLKHEPVSARPDSFGYRAAKFVRRNRIPVALSTLAIVALLAGLAGTITQADRATRQAALAQLQSNRADQQASAATEQRDFALRQLSRSHQRLNQLPLRCGAVGQVIHRGRVARPCRSDRRARARGLRRQSRGNACIHRPSVPVYGTRRQSEGAA